MTNYIYSPAFKQKLLDMQVTGISWAILSKNKNKRVVNINCLQVCLDTESIRKILQISEYKWVQKIKEKDDIKEET